jgi:hypothetical protein
LKQFCRGFPIRAATVRAMPLVIHLINWQNVNCVTDVRCATALLPSLNTHGQTWYVTVRDENATPPIALRH